MALILLSLAGQGCAASISQTSGSARADRQEAPPAPVQVAPATEATAPVADSAAAPATSAADGGGHEADGGAVRAASSSAMPSDDARYIDVVTEQGQRARGLYFNAPMARRLGSRGVINMVRAAGFNAAVIDIKDGEGRVTFDTQIEDLQASKHVLLRDAAGYVRELKDAGIYAIARVVCFSDPVIPKLHPDRAVLDSRPGHEGDVWEKNAHRNTWLDPYNTKNHDMLVALAKEVESLGFDEIQLDYIRFPVDVATKWAVFPAQTDKLRREVLVTLLGRIDEAIHIPLGVDVFGLTAFRKGDPDGLGQSLEDWAKHIEVFSPMLYVYGMKTWMRQQKQSRAGLLVEQGVKIMRERLGPLPVIRPFLQGFQAGADYWNAEFIAEQIRGTRNGGGDGVLFWHPGSNYGMVKAGSHQPEFPMQERQSARERSWGGKPTEQPAMAHETHAEKPTS